MAKGKKARAGAAIYVAAAAGAVAVSMAFGWCGSESYTRTDLLTGLERPRSTPCGVVRFFSAGLLDWVPCQFWNLMPLTLVGVWALVWLVRDLARSHH